MPTTVEEGTTVFVVESYRFDRERLRSSHFVGGVYLSREGAQSWRIEAHQRGELHSADEVTISEHKVQP